MKAINFLINEENKPQYVSLSVNNCDCPDCPFSSISEGEEEYSKDPQESYFDCELTGNKRIWGENPTCTNKDWINQLKKEISIINKPL